MQKTVEIQAKMLATAIEGDSDEVLRAVNLYTQALTLLDKYDHQSLEKPEGKQPIYRITYADCRAMVDRMEDSFKKAFGHQSFTGTLTMIDPDNDLVIVFLTNKIHSKIKPGDKTLNRFLGNYYTTGSLGFVIQIIEESLSSPSAVTPDQHQ